MRRGPIKSHGWDPDRANNETLVEEGAASTRDPTELLSKSSTNSAAPSVMDLFEGCSKRFGDPPARVVRLQLLQIGYVADMVSRAILINVLVFHRLAGYLRNKSESLQYGYRVVTSTTKIVNFAFSRCGDESLDKCHNVVAVYVVSDLLSFVTEYLVGTALDIAFDQIAEEAVELDATVVGTRQTSAPEAAGWQSEGPPVLLNHDVGRYLRGSKKRVFALVNSEGFVNSIRVVGICVFPACFGFDEWDFVGAIPVDLVGAHVHKRSLRRCQTGRLEHVERTYRIDIEIIERPAGGEVMTGLRRGMNHGVRPQGLQ